VAVSAKRNVDQGPPDRVTSLKTEKKAYPQLGTPLLVLTGGNPPISTPI
jgi:hypothetical protein